MSWFVVYYVLILAVDVTVSVITNGNLAATMVAGFGVVFGAAWGSRR